MLNFTIDLAKKAGEIILSEKKKLVVEKKSRREIVTNADIAAENYITSRILEKYPNHHILGEESFIKTQDYQHSADLWIIDPIDGTTNFAQGLTEYGVSVGYYHNLAPVVGVIYFPEKNMFFSSQISRGAYLNGNKIHVSNKKDMKDAVLGSLFSYDTDENMIIFDISKKLYREIKTIRFFGSAVLDICFVAQGTLDGTVGYALKPWDTAAAYLIVKEAGAVVTTLKGRPWNIFEKELLVANKFIHPQLVNFFTQILP
ncbi:inositol monophosphatase [Candidatus Gottesmanbacteria bacterium]|nr:inositol monophosphatase [Candidatus Gottesmanbacteria bacterium]